MESLEQGPSQFIFEIIDGGDVVNIQSDNREQLLEKAWQIYCGLAEQDPELYTFERNNIISEFESGSTLRPNGFGMDLSNDILSVRNQNGQGYQPNRDLMKEVIGY